MDDKARENLEFARSFFGDNDDGTMLPEDADWTEERFPLSKLASIMEGGPGGWKEWFRQEVEHRRMDLAPMNDESFIVHWETFAEVETDEPCVIAVDEDGRVQVWDGFHRIGGAFMREAETIPAIVGRRKFDRVPPAP